MDEYKSQAERMELTKAVFFIINSYTLFVKFAERFDNVFTDS